MVLLKTKRLEISDHTPEDLKPMHKLLSDPEAMYFLDDIKTKTLKDTQSNLETAIADISNPNRTKYFFKIVESETGKYVGEIGFTIKLTTPKGSIAELGYFTLPEFWGKGITTEAAREVIKFAFEKTHVVKIETGCIKANKASEAIMIKLGFIKEAEFKAKVWHDNQFKDRVEYRLLKEEWENVKLSNIIGRGAQATIYLMGEYAIKVFKENYPKRSIFYEAYLNSVIEFTDLMVPKVHEVINVNNQLAIKMDYIQGKSLVDCIQESPEKLTEYINTKADLHIEIHSKKPRLPFSFKDILRTKIVNNHKLNEEQKDKFLNKLKELPEGDTLCHGDFHGYNILVNKRGLWVIDWIDASYGSPLGDVCRTYLIYQLHAEELAELYLNTYCHKTGIERAKILEWLPVMAAARISDNIPNEEEKLMELINSENGKHS